MQPKQGNGATMMQEIGTSFHYLNRGTWATHVQLASLAFMLESPQLLCAKPPKSPHLRPSSGLWNPNHLRPLHVGDDFLGHPNGLVPTPLLLHLPNLVCNHLAISLLLDDIGVALGLVLAVGLGVDEGALDCGLQFLLCALVHLLDKLRAFVELVPLFMTLVASHG